MSDAALTDATVPAAHDGGAAVPTRRRRRRTDGSSAAVAGGSSRWVVLGVLVLLALYAVAPLWWLLVSATKSRGDLYRGNGMWFTEFHLVENLQALFTYQDGIFARWLWNTVVYSGLSSLGLTAVAVQGDHQQRPPALTHRIHAHERFELANHLA